MVLVLVGGVGLITGLAGGFIVAKRAQWWCPDCGARLGCTQCSARPSPTVRRKPPRTYRQEAQS